MNFKKVISLSLAILFAFTFLSFQDVAAEETTYFHMFTNELNEDYGNAPDEMVFNSDGSVTFNNTTVSRQKQGYFGFDKAMATSALEVSNGSNGSGQIAITVNLESCLNEYGDSSLAEIKIWLDTTKNDADDEVIQKWQNPYTTVTYLLDVSQVQASELKGFYIGIMNYSNGKGIAPKVTYSAATVHKPVDTSSYFHTFSQSLKVGYGNGPDKMAFNDDGSVTFINITPSNQKQGYFNINKDLATTALEKAKQQDNKLFVTVRLDSCIDINGNDADGEIKLWLDTVNPNSGDAIITKWQSPNTTTTYQLDISHINADEITGFYVGIMNYSLPSGIIPTVTFSAVMTQTPVLDNEKLNEFDYSIKSDSTIEITKYNLLNENILIPNKIDGKTVTSIGNGAFEFLFNAKNVVLPDTILEIGQNAFYGCTNLEEISLGKNIILIDKYAFAECESLTKIELPNTVTEIGYSAFNNCKSLTGLELPNSITFIGSSAFKGCKSLTKITLPEKLNAISNSLFEDCEALKEITIPKSVEKIGVFAFKGCDDITVHGWRESNAKTYSALYSLDFVTKNSGDVNRDKSVNAKDSLALRKYISNYGIEIDIIAADLNYDGNINAKDSLYLRKLNANAIDQEKVTPLDESLSLVEKYKALHELSWSDEFGGDALNKTDWSYEGSQMHRNNELQTYCDFDEQGNVYLENGNLVIEARKEQRNGMDYTSGSIMTLGKQHFKYGIYEVSAVLPKGKGVWPAFWMLGVDPNTGRDRWPYSGELDIFELVGGGADDSTAYGTAHATDKSNYHVAKGDSYRLPNGVFNDDFHTLGVIWTETDIYWYVDDVVYFTLDTTNPDYQAFNKYEFYIIINLGIGGSWPGDPAPTTVFPAKYIVDFVRVYQ